MTISLFGNQSDTGLLRGELSRNSSVCLHADVFISIKYYAGAFFAFSIVPLSFEPMVILFADKCAFPLMHGDRMGGWEEEG